MSRELPVYNGALPSMPKQQMPRVQAPAKAKGIGEAVDNALEAGVKVVNKVIDLHDFDVQQEAELKRRNNGLEATIALEKRMAFAPGHKDSFYYADGSMNEDAVNAFISEFQQKNDAIETDFWGVKRAVAEEARRNDDNASLGEKIKLTLAGREMEHRRRIFDDNVNLAVEQGAFDKAKRTLREGLEAGRITQAEYGRRLLKVAKAREEKAVSDALASKNPFKGRQITADIANSFIRKPSSPNGDTDSSYGVPSTEGVVFEPTGEMTYGPPGLFPDDNEQQAPEAAATDEADPGMKAIPADERVEALQDAQTLASAGSIRTDAQSGALIADLGSAPSKETVSIVGVAQYKTDYSLEDYRKGVLPIAANYMLRPEMEGMNGGKLITTIKKKVFFEGAADLWFNGDETLYEGWLTTQLKRALAVRGSGAIEAADRAMAGAEGRQGMNKLLTKYVTDEEIMALPYGFNAIAEISRKGLPSAPKKQEEMNLGVSMVKAFSPAARQALDQKDKARQQEAMNRQQQPEAIANAQLYKRALDEFSRYEQQWRQELAAAGDKKYKPSTAKTVEERFEKDWREYADWYLGKEDLYKTRFKALADGVRNIFVVRTLDALGELRTTGQVANGAETVKLDGKNDWAMEEKVIKYQLSKEVSEEEFGTARLIAKAVEQQYNKKKEQAERYAQLANEQQAILDEQKAAYATAKEADKAEEEKKKELEKTLDDAVRQRMLGYSKTKERVVHCNTTLEPDGPPVVVVPRSMYKEITESLGATKGFYANFNDGDVAIPVRAGDVNGIYVNLPMLNILNGEKGKMNALKMDGIMNEDGLGVNMKFSVTQSL